ncbi:hypothetical protein T10_2762 [Trichinella papuae]|uniref:Uncharacterized protein n=1 Tax=Trichinella papuae TaxID=268474 RepID=A0A0V1N367_9BILA|nr:hypothetical protein T10_2762 [Trichinella papuae]
MIRKIADGSCCKQLTLFKHGKRRYHNCTALVVHFGRIGSTSGKATNVEMDQVIKSAQEAAGALERELLQEFPSREAIDKYRVELVRLLCHGDKLKTLRHGTRSSVEWEQFANLMREQVGAADEWLRQTCQVSTAFPGCHRNSDGSLLETKAEGKEAPESIAAVAAWDNDEREGQRRLDQITAAMESTDFTVALQRNPLILKIQRAEKTAETLRRWCDDSQLSRESRIRLEELSIDLDAMIMTAAERLNLQESSLVSGLAKGIKKGMSRDLVQNNNMVSSGKEELPICAEPLSTTSNVVLRREQHETLGASTHKPFDLMKDGGDLISAILGQKAEDQIPNFRGGAAEYPAWEEAIAPIRYCSFRQPIMKFNAIKKSLSGEALEVVKWIRLDQPDPVEALVDALKKEYGRPEIVIRAQEVRLEKLASPKEDDYPTLRNFVIAIVIRAQEVRLEKLASPKEDDYPTLRNFVIAVRSIIATMKAHGYDVEKNPQFTRQLEKKLNWVLVKRWCQKRNGDTPNHLLDFLEKEAEILQKAHLFKPDVITGQRTPQVVKAKERRYHNCTALVVHFGYCVSNIRFECLPVKSSSSGRLDIWFMVLRAGFEPATYGLLVAYRCKLGWTISGPRLPSDKEAVMYCCIINDEVDHGTALLQEFRNFNSLEGLGITDKSLGLSRRETEDLEHMQNGTVVLSDGRFQIPMLWKWPGGVPPSEEQAKRRLISL